MARKPNYATLDSMYQEKTRRLSAYEILVELQVKNVEPIKARINQSDTEYQDEFFTAAWYGESRMDCGVILIAQHYGPRGINVNSTVLWYGELESSQDSDYQRLRERLNTARYKALTVDDEGVSRITQSA
jgi:hypothetical protein